MTESKLPLLIYDGQCAFCLYCVGFAQAATGDAVEFQTYQNVQSKFSHISEKEFRASIQLIHADRSVTAGAQAAFQTLALGSYTSFWAWCYRKLPLFAWISEKSYRFVSTNRNACYTISKILFGSSLQPQSLSLTIGIFLRSLALIYLAAFVSFAVQAPGLIGQEGILPIADYYAYIDENLGPEKYWRLPSLFWLSTSEHAIQSVGLAGALLSLLLFINFKPGPCLIGLYCLYLTIFGGGRVFMSFQWDILLL